MNSSYIYIKSTKQIEWDDFQTRELRIRGQSLEHGSHHFIFNM